MTSFSSFQPAYETRTFFNHQQKTKNTSELRKPLYHQDTKPKEKNRTVPKNLETRKPLKNGRPYSHQQHGNLNLDPSPSKTATPHSTHHHHPSHPSTPHLPNNPPNNNHTNPNPSPKQSTTIPTINNNPLLRSRTPANHHPRLRYSSSPIFVLSPRRNPRGPVFYSQTTRQKIT